MRLFPQTPSLSTFLPESIQTMTQEVKKYAKPILAGIITLAALDVLYSYSQEVNLLREGGEFPFLSKNCTALSTNFETVANQGNLTELLNFSKHCKTDPTQFAQSFSNIFFKSENSSEVNLEYFEKSADSMSVADTLIELAKNPFYHFFNQTKIKDAAYSEYLSLLGNKNIAEAEKIDQIFNGTLIHTLTQKFIDWDSEKKQLIPLGDTQIKAAVNYIQSNTFEQNSEQLSIAQKTLKLFTLKRIFSLGLYSKCPDLEGTFELFVYNKIFSLGLNARCDNPEVVQNNLKELDQFQNSKLTFDYETAQKFVESMRRTHNKNFEFQTESESNYLSILMETDISHYMDIIGARYQLYKRGLITGKMPPTSFNEYSWLQTKYIAGLVFDGLTKEIPYLVMNRLRRISEIAWFTLTFFPNKYQEEGFPIFDALPSLNSLNSSYFFGRATNP